MMKKDSLNKMLGIVLRIADIVDRHGEKGEECYILDELGYGYLALSGYLRDGVKSAIDIQDKYSSLKNRLNYTEESEKDARNFLEDIFGDREPDTLNDEHKEKIREFISNLFKD
ncbi:MAG: hypothetical protein HFH88_11090 [Lachnospiraceae bacterium]|nr:hypothetical protein [Lachnospiraceae bacterium]